MKYLSHSEQATSEIAKSIIKEMPNGGLIALYGDLGTGKTVLAKALAKELGVPEKTVKSPTFTILREYSLKKGYLYHYDFYRQEEEIDHILAHQFAEQLALKDNYIIVEWAEKIAAILPANRIDVYLQHGSEPNERIISVKNQL